MRRALVALALVALCAVLGACGASAAPSPQATPPAAPAPPPASFWHLLSAEGPPDHPHTSVYYACWEGDILFMASSPQTTGTPPITVQRAVQGQECFR